MADFRRFRALHVVEPVAGPRPGAPTVAEPRPPGRFGRGTGREARGVESLRPRARGERGDGARAGVTRQSSRTGVAGRVRGVAGRVRRCGPTSAQMTPTHSGR